MSLAARSLVLLFDVDNTLIDNDQITRDLSEHLQAEFGRDCRERYFAIFEQLRAELGYADYLGALQRYRAEHPREVRLLKLSSYLIDYPFADRLYPGALGVLEKCRSLGKVVILSDGDVVFQPRKVKRSGIGAAVEGNVLIYIHKEQVLDDVERRFPADHYVFVDDKPRLVAAIKNHWADRVTTVLPRQGHYALDIATANQYPAPDITIERIGDFLAIDPIAKLVGR